MAKKVRVSFRVGSIENEPTGDDLLPDEWSIDRIQHMTVIINHESKNFEQEFSFPYGWKWESEEEYFVNLTFKEA
jgi:hypothetical protein